MDEQTPIHFKEQFLSTLKFIFAKTKIFAQGVPRLHAAERLNIILRVKIIYELYPFALLSPALPDDELAKLWFGCLPKLFPEFGARRVEGKHIFRFRAAQHIVDTNYEEKILDYRTPVPGVFLSNFSQIFPEDRGTNFAVREGLKIAGMIQQEATA